MEVDLSGIDAEKGFIYTLESVIAASLMLGTVIFVIPEVQQTGTPALEDLNTALVSLDQRDELGDSILEIETVLDSYAPSNYNMTVRTESVRTRDISINGEESLYIEEGNKDVMMWIESAADLDVTYRGDTVFDRDETGYQRLEIGEKSGYLNFTGSPELDLRVNHYRDRGNLTTSSQAYTTNYLDYNGTLREVQVIVWR